MNFELKDSVLIKGNDKVGRVVGIWQSEDGSKSYSVRYFLSTGEARTDHFDASDLQKV